jgi:hypothetical protein
MTTPRRDFLGWLGISALISASPTSLLAGAPGRPVPLAGPEDWDMTWVTHLSGRYKQVIDVPEPQGGVPIVQANIVGAQYADVFGIPLADVSRVLVLRHRAIHLAMNDDYWRQSGIGAEIGFSNADGSAVDHNPIRIPGTMLPEPMRPAMLVPFQQSGGMVLCCNLALQFLVVPRYVARGMSQDEAYAAAKRDVLPGITLQPSGIFAVSVAQDNGCSLVPTVANE